ncbi:hypothetical protein [Serratia liquefaciens]|uniref:hypothetical protein n=1 Tax=Serratia liquefaciens TaxID=614 RepID=UPI003905D941
MSEDKVKNLIEDCIILSLRTEAIFRSSETEDAKHRGNSEILMGAGFYFSRELNEKLAALESAIYSK